LSKIGIRVSKKEHPDDMEPGELLTRWSVRLAMVLYVTALAIRITAGKRGAWLRVARLAWTIGCGAFVVHVICAFAFFHHWSHAAAYEETARRTEELVGISWGGGLYLNYTFTVLWTADVIFWWRNPHRTGRRGIHRGIRQRHDWLAGTRSHPILGPFACSARAGR
jgi:hypothetical protein